MSHIVTQRFIKCVNKLKENKTVRSDRQFALSVDYLPQSYSEIVRGRREVTLELLYTSIEKYKINPLYIYTGNGPLFMTEQTSSDLRVLTVVTNTKESERIVWVPVMAQMNYAAEINNPSFIQTLATFSLPEQRFKGSTFRAFEMNGDSMNPTIKEGEKVIGGFVEPTAWSTAIQENFVYIVVLRSQIVIRRARLVQLDGITGLELFCDNAFYPVKQVMFSEISELWFVQATIAPFGISAPPSKENEELRRMLEELQEVLKTIKS